MDFEDLVERLAGKLALDAAFRDEARALSGRFSDLRKAQRETEEKILTVSRGLALGEDRALEEQLQELRAEVVRLGDLISGAEAASNAKRRDLETRARRMQPLEVALLERFESEARAHLRGLRDQHATWLEAKLTRLRELRGCTSTGEDLATFLERHAPRFQVDTVPWRDSRSILGAGGTMHPVSGTSARDIIERAVASLS